MTQERRQHKRYNFKSRVVYAPVGAPDLEAEVESTDISMGGIGLALKKLIDDHTKINMKIFHNGTGLVVDAQGEVRWQRDQQGDKVRAGIRFQMVAFTDLKRILAYTAVGEDPLEEYVPIQKDTPE